MPFHLLCLPITYLVSGDAALQFDEHVHPLLLESFLLVLLILNPPPNPATQTTEAGGRDWRRTSLTHTLMSYHYMHAEHQATSLGKVDNLVTYKARTS